MISPNSYTRYSTIFVTYDGFLNDGTINYMDILGANNNLVKPTLYLKSNVKITSGDGTSEQPYQLEI